MRNVDKKASEGQDAKRVLIAGSGSGSGKTTIVCGLLRALQKRGETPAAYKCGPDYIDPLYHREVLGIESRNLDSFFMSKEQLNDQLFRGNKSFSLIEGVMGYYDGLGTQGRYSSAEIAELTGTPVILIIDCAGRSVSAIAELQGFVNFRPEGRRIRGVIFNRLSAALYPQLAAMAEETGIRPCGYLPKNAVKKWESRHLGLITPNEMPAFREEADLLAEKLAETVDMEAVHAVAAEAKGYDSSTKTVIPESERSGYRANGVTSQAADLPVIAVARDEAFCFYYIANIEYLEENGCKIVYFSPIRDSKLPECDGLIMPGGYPELYAKKLSDNTELREDIRERIENGLPTIAECGGFLYLHKELTDAEGCCYSMAGTINEGCRYKGLQKTFGYVNVYADADSLIGIAGAQSKGHEFHYFVSDLLEGKNTELGPRRWQPEDCVFPGGNGRFLICEKPDGSRLWADGIVTKTLYAGFAHLYLPDSPAGEGFLESVKGRA